MKKLKEYNFKQGKRISLFDKFKIMQMLDHTSIHDKIKIDRMFYSYEKKIKRNNCGKR